MRRDQFHLPGKHYFLSHSIGAQPKTYDAAIAGAYLEPWRSAGEKAWDPWFKALAAFREGLGALIGADANDICPQTNVSSGLAKILFALPDRPARRRIVLTEDDFPTVGFTLAQARRLGYELVFLPGGERLADPDAWAPAFQDDVQLVLATQVFSNTGVLAPCADIARRAKEAGVFSVFDIAQAAGAVPVKLNEWGADFALGTSQKYLCGGTGAAYLWASQEAAAQAEPMDVGWFSHENPFEFDIRNFQYAEGAARFTGGTPSFGPFAGATAAQAIFNDAGIEAIYAHNQRLMSALIGALPEDAFFSTRAQGARGSAAIIKVRDYDAAAAALREAGVIHDARKGGVRVSIHLYNDETDVAALIEALTPHL